MCRISAYWQSIGAKKHSFPFRTHARASTRELIVGAEDVSGLGG